MQPYDQFPVVKTTELSSKNLRFLGLIIVTFSKYSSVLSILAGAVASHSSWEIFFHVIPSLFRVDHKIADSLGHSCSSWRVSSNFCWTETVIVFAEYRMCSLSSGNSCFPLMYGLPWLFTNDISQFVQTKLKILKIFSKSRVIFPTISFLV